MENENTQKRFITAIVLNIICAVMGIISCTGSFWLETPGFLCLRWYTVLSNILAACTSSIWLAFAFYSMGAGQKKVPEWVQTLHYISTCCLFLTFVIVVLVLLPQDYITRVKKGESGMIAVYNKLVSGVNIWHHPALPLLSLISVIFFEKKPKLSFKVTFLAMIPTALYALTLMILNFCRIVDGPYFFLKVYNQPWYMSIMWFVVILGVDYGLSCALWGLNGIKNKE